MNHRLDAGKASVGRDATVQDVIARIDSAGEGIALLVEDGTRLVATFTDGDVRRALLHGVKLEDSVGDLLAAKQRFGKASVAPVTAKVGSSEDELLQRMRDYEVRHLPLVDEAGKVAEIALLDELLLRFELPIQAVVMAGGFGKRMLPLTHDVPKPMLRVGGRPMLEWIVEQLGRNGIKRVTMTLHYRSEQVIDYFGNGDRFGLQIDYVEEEEPLGTAGSLRLVERTEDPLLVINGDVLTSLDAGHLLAYHREQGSELTVGVRRYEVQIPYGVVECDGFHVQRLVEKPTIDFLVNSGVYLLESRTVDLIPVGRPFHMTELVHAVIENGGRVASFLIHEYWSDIGQHDEYERANLDHGSGDFL